MKELKDTEKHFPGHIRINGLRMNEKVFKSNQEIGVVQGYFFQMKHDPTWYSNNICSLTLI